MAAKTNPGSQYKSDSGYADSTNSDAFERLVSDVIEAGLCTHCGTCVGLSAGHLQMTDTSAGPLPTPKGRFAGFVPEEAYLACPGKGLDYPELNRHVFGRLPGNWLVGNVNKTFVGYARDESIRRNGASGGVITACLIYLLEKRIVDGAIMLRQGAPTAWQASPIVAHTRQEVLSASQSVYVPSPVNTILDELQKARGKFAFVGLPDQVAAVRRLQQLNHPVATRISHVLGIYFGTAMYFDAVMSFLRSHGIRHIDEIERLRYRDGEWPGNLSITTKSGRLIQARKFHYNYLIPFYITRSSLLSVDFTNELADLSVGDAWHPMYEKDRKGYSVVIGRNEKAGSILSEMCKEGALVLEEKPLDFIITMHGHMIDFKKRGTFLRLRWRKKFHKKIPEFGYSPTRISVSRQMIEAVIDIVFLVGRSRLARKLLEIVPLWAVGPLFDVLRKSWKNLSKPAKRKGLANYEVELTRNGPR